MYRIMIPKRGLVETHEILTVLHDDSGEYFKKLKIVDLDEANDIVLRVKREIAGACYKIIDIYLN